MNIESLSNYKMAQYQYAYGVKMAKNDTGYGKQQGANVMKLIQSAQLPKQSNNIIDLYA